MGQTLKPEGSALQGGDAAGHDEEVSGPQRACERRNTAAPGRRGFSQVRGSQIT